MTDDTLALLAAAGLEKCLLKMTEVSAGAWRLAGARVSRGTVRDAIKRDRGTAPTAALKVKIKGAPPFATAFIFNPEDTSHISGCFLDGSFCSLPDWDQPEVTIIEIGNVVLNALANSLLRAIGATAVPSVPAYFKGDTSSIEKWLDAGPGTFTVVSARLTMHRGDRTAEAEVFAFLPAALAASHQKK
jgi:hypothetical protein